LSAKVKWFRDAWWVITHHRGSRSVRRVGATKRDHEAALQIATKVNAALALGLYKAPRDEARPLRCDAELRAWHSTYAPTMKPSYSSVSDRLIEVHLVPFFGAKDLRSVREADLLRFIGAKLDQGLAPKTIQNALSILRRVCSLLVHDDQLAKNPASRVGELIRRVHKASARETTEVEAWERGEVETLIAVAREHEPRFAPLLVLLLSTGLRRGEALGLKWSDVNFEAATITVRRAVLKEGISTPKSGRARRVPLTFAATEELLDVLAARRQEALNRGWPEVPAWVFSSETGGASDPRNVERVWYRIRRRAQARGVRPLKLHATRHTWATLALQAGKSIRWVAEILGHADPALTLRVYAHAMRHEESDLSFAQFGGARRHQTAPILEERTAELRKFAKILARREGFEPPTPRFEAWCSIQLSYRRGTKP